MSTGKLSPRQKMINMMYLVLTALLALSVTREVINAFITINDSLAMSADNIDRKNQNTYSNLERAYKIDSIKYKEVSRKAKIIRKAANELNRFIEETKDILIRKSDRLDNGEPTPKLSEMKNTEEFDIPTNIMIGNDDQYGRKGVALKLKNKLEDYKKLLIENAPEESKAEYKKHLNTLLNTEDPLVKEDGKSTWELNSFYHNLVVADVALLTKIQTDVRSAEQRVAAELYSSVDIDIVKVNRFDAKVIPMSTVVTTGSDFKAKVFLSAFSSTLDPEIFVGATTDSAGSPNCKGCDIARLPVVNGEGIYTDHPVTEGEKKWSGVIRARREDGSYQHFPFSSSYVAQRPTGIVSAENMNLLYIGVENPMGISVPGVSSDKVSVVTEGETATLKPNREKGNGHFLCEVFKEGKISFKVFAEIAGNKVNMGAYEYRIRKVPKPDATISKNYRGGKISKEILTAGALIPVLDRFEFPLYYVTTGFNMIILNSPKYIELPSTSSNLTNDMKDAIRNAKSGTKILFENIYARINKPGTKTELLQSLSFTIQ
jgi:gliding motility-associated protein GldM